jgi:hypothetical protein
MSSMVSDFTEVHKKYWAGTIIADNLPTSGGSSNHNTAPVTVTPTETTASPTEIKLTDPENLPKEEAPATPGAAQAQAQNEFLKKRAVTSGILDTTRTTEGMGSILG